MQIYSLKTDHVLIFLENSFCTYSCKCYPILESIVLKNVLFQQQEKPWKRKIPNLENRNIKPCNSLYASVFFCIITNLKSIFSLDIELTPPLGLMWIRLSYLICFRKLTKRPPDGVVHLYFSLSGFLTYLPVKTLIMLVYDIQNDNYYIIIYRFFLIILEIFILKVYESSTYLNFFNNCWIFLNLKLYVRVWI